MTSRHGLVTLVFGDGDHAFRLGLRELAELEDKIGKSIFAIAADLASRVATSTAIVETLRIGLIGGGMRPENALALVRRYADQRPLDDSRDVALAVCLAALARVHSPEVGLTPGEDVAPVSSGSISAPFSSPAP